MHQETGKIEVKPPSMSEEDWRKYCEQNGLIPMSEDEFRRVRNIRPKQRIRMMQQVRTLTPGALKGMTEKVELENKAKKKRREKNKQARKARKRR